MNTSITPLRRKTIIGWLLATTFFLGLIAYEWIPSYLRGGWIFFVGMVMIGAFLKVTYAILVGLVFFLGASVYFLFKLNSGVSIDNQVLLLLMTPFAPIGFSAVLHNLDLRKNASHSLVVFKQKIEHEIIPLQLLDTFLQSQLTLLCRPDISLCYARLTSIEITIKNAREIEDLLGSDEWLNIRSKVLLYIEKCIANGFHVFGDIELDKLVLVNVDSGSSEITEQFIKNIKEISSLKTEISRIVYEPNFA
ncbi:MAG: hypothetical protein Q8L72_01955 [Moraxellaceae bacterium]|nr:hypothetical protein [Moraxellaceae bacterium]